MDGQLAGWTDGQMDGWMDTAFSFQPDVMLSWGSTTYGRVAFTTSFNLSEVLLLRFSDPNKMRLFF